VDAAIARYGASMRSSTTRDTRRREDLRCNSRNEDWRTGFDLLFLNVVRVARLGDAPALARGTGLHRETCHRSVQYEPAGRFPSLRARASALGAYVKLYSERYRERRRCE
jgi:hypothetical protein